jgi:hypothetical protein
MTVTENIFLAWGLFSGGVVLLVATLMYRSTRQSVPALNRPVVIVVAVLSRLAGVSRIEAVFRAHVGDDCEVLAASDETDDG